MYLNQLNEREKQLFLHTSLCLAEADGNFSDDEKKIIRQMCQEMQIPVCFENDDNLERILEELSQISLVTHRKIILLELAGVVMADGVYDESEKLLIQRICEALSLPERMAEEMIAVVIDLESLYQRIASLITETDPI